MQIGTNYQTQSASYTSAKTSPPSTQQSSTKTSQTDSYQPSTQTTQSATYTKPTVTEAETDKESQKAKAAAFVEQANIENQERQKQMMQDFVKNNVSNQSGMGYTGNTDILKEIFGSVDEALPPMATTPEGAAAAVAPGGAYSVEAVSDRLMEMAKAFAGDDPEMIEEMQNAVKKGFEQAGMDLETGEGLPDISFETFNATMEKFEKWKAEVAATPEVQ
ncbi:hypothetical protein AN639_12500 [Candidatus Epulonipiscium fishelsonii]|uniref:Uncharacterized protein n=1 Tax=Candidatus Epulonipiscium fishelsonii TaxID=77094 RepID=A0ACC8XC44_9FIRM|nr:hypothetical protein AN396_01270 [Epulopiscium sp. SCG-B11WGA-EpuloA1]ONI42473.1 hypothetical protein AN639_12500 [Epulopiscium sp. SCG-B05WGA-EpuloA1]